MYLLKIYSKSVWAGVLDIYFTPAIEYSWECTYKFSFAMLDKVFNFILVKETIEAFLVLGL